MLQPSPDQRLIRLWLRFRQAAILVDTLLDTAAPLLLNTMSLRGVALGLSSCMLAAPSVDETYIARCNGSSHGEGEIPMKITSRKTELERRRSPEVAMRFFGSLTYDQAAEALHLSTATHDANCA